MRGFREALLAFTVRSSGRLKVRYHPSAAKGLQKIYLYLVRQGVSDRAARDYVLRIRNTCAGIGDAVIEQVFYGGRDFEGAYDGRRRSPGRKQS